MESEPRTLPTSANDDAINNPSANDPFSNVLQRYVSRRASPDGLWFDPLITT